MASIEDRVSVTAMRRLSMATAIVGFFTALGSVRAGWFDDSPAVARIKKAVAEIVPLPGGAVLVRNEHAKLFETIDDGKTWHELGGGVRQLAVSNGDKLWAFHGWPGRHESPSAAVSYSADRGRTWQETTFHVPDGKSEAMYARLPAAFLNAPSEDALLLMFNLQIFRPLPGKEPEAWTKVGVPVPVAARPFGQWFGAAAANRGVYYVAYQSRISMSTDGARTWSAKPTHDFLDARIRCRPETFALLSELGSQWSGLFSVTSGKNDWTELGSLSLDAVKTALKPIAQGRSPVERFGPFDLLVTDEGILIAGIVNSGPRPWGAVLLAKPAAPLKAVGTAVDDGLWRLERDAHGVVWAGGQGAFQLRGGAWQRVWAGE